MAKLAAMQSCTLPLLSNNKHSMRLVGSWSNTFNDLSRTQTDHRSITLDRVYGSLE